MLLRQNPENIRSIDAPDLLHSFSRHLNDEERRRQLQQLIQFTQGDLIRAHNLISEMSLPLNCQEQSLVHQALYGHGPNSEQLAKYKSHSIQRSSIRTLRPGTWLNDEVINYFHQCCLSDKDEQLYAANPEKLRSHFFSSYFVQLLLDEKNQNPELRGTYNYENVKRWGDKVPGKDIFQLKYLFFPINLDNVHWTLAVIFMKEKRIQYYDSLGGTDDKKLSGLLQYLKDEHRTKKETDLQGDWQLVRCTTRTPRQNNGYDCGVFTCMFSYFILFDCPLVFTQALVDKCRNRIALSIVTELEG